MSPRMKQLLFGVFILGVAQAGAEQKRDSRDVVLVQGYGVGMSKTCGAFIRETDERDAHRALDYDGKSYHPERRLYFEWLSGFFTARSLAGQPSVTGDKNMNDMLTWIRKYCESHPLDQFLTAAIKLTAEVSTPQ